MQTMVRRVLGLLASVAMLLMASATQGIAQEGGLRVVVEQIAGANVYLSAGTEAGLAAGDTLQVYREDDGEYLGAFRVVASSSERAVVVYIGEPFPVTRGIAISVRRNGTAPNGEQAPVRAVSTRSTSPTAAPRPRAAPRLRGRLGLDFSGVQSTTKWLSNDEESVERRFATPSLSLRLDATDLPGGLRFETSARAYYRYSDPTLVQPDVAVRVYQLSVVKRFNGFPLEFRMGRFYNAYERYSGYWDGALVRVGGRSFGVGALAGFQPDRANEAPSSGLPKYSVFVDFAAGRGSVRYATDISFHQVRPRDEWLVHTFAGWSQYLRVGGVRLSTDVQVDRDVELNAWKLGRLQVSGIAPLTRGLSLYGRYARSRPYLLFRTTDLMPFKRDQGSSGLSYFGGGVSLSADVTATRFDGGEWGLGVGGSFALLRTGVLGLSWSGAGNYWTLGDGHALQVAADASRPIGRGEVRLSYQLYRTENPGAQFTSHAGGIRATVPLGRRAFASAELRRQQGANLVSTSLNVSLWTSF